MLSKICLICMCIFHGREALVACESLFLWFHNQFISMTIVYCLKIVLCNQNLTECTSSVGYLRKSLAGCFQTHRSEFASAVSGLSFFFCVCV